MLAGMLVGTGILAANDSGFATRRLYSGVTGWRRLCSSADGRYEASGRWVKFESRNRIEVATPRYIAKGRVVRVVLEEFRETGITGDTGARRKPRGRTAVIPSGGHGDIGVFPRIVQRPRRRKVAVIFRAKVRAIWNIK
jgi:hypothetical protein